MKTYFFLLLFFTIMYFSIAHAEEDLQIQQDFFLRRHHDHPREQAVEIHHSAPVEHYYSPTPVPHVYHPSPSPQIEVHHYQHHEVDSHPKVEQQEHHKQDEANRIVKHTDMIIDSPVKKDKDSEIHHIKEDRPHDDVEEQHLEKLRERLHQHEAQGKDVSLIKKKIDNLKKKNLSLDKQKDVAPHKEAESQQKKISEKIKNPLKQKVLKEQKKPVIHKKKEQSTTKKPELTNNEISQKKDVYTRQPVKQLLHNGEKGIDVSNYQGSNINWNEVKTKGHVKFAFIKATQGISYIDSDFQRNWKLSGKAGVQRGAYCFFDAHENPIQQAKFFIQHAHKGELPPVLDLETTNGMSNEEVESRALEWLKYVDQHFQKPVLYTYSSFGDSILKNKEFEKYPLWIADVGPSHPQVPPTWKGHYVLWQYGQGHVPGISGSVDKDISH